MGCAFRTKTYLTLNLPTMFWKFFTKEKILIEDLYEIDFGIKYLYDFIHSCNEQEFNESVFSNFETNLSNNDTVSLIKNGN